MKDLKTLITNAKAAGACETVLQELEQYKSVQDVIDNYSHVAMCAWWYAKYVIKGRWPEAEPIILTSPMYAYWYALEIIKGRWPEAEELILTDCMYTYWYMGWVIKGSWPEAILVLGEKAYSRLLNEVQEGKCI